MNSTPETNIRFFQAELQDSQSSAEDIFKSPVSYWLLLAFLFLVYANLPFVLPAVEVIRPAKLVGGAALVMLLVEVMTGQRKLELAWPDGSLLLWFLGAGAMSCLTALWPRQAAEAVSDLVKMILAYFFIVNCANTSRRLRGVMWTMLIGGVLAATGTLRNFLAGNLMEGRARWVGIFSNPNEVAYSLVILVPIALALMPGLRLPTKLLLLAMTGLYAAAIVVTFSRGGYLGLAAAMAIYAWRKRSIWLQAAMVGGIIVAVVLGSQYWSRNEDFSNLNGDVSFQQRLATSQAGLSMFLDHPVLGVGLGCSVIAWPLYAPKTLYSRTALVTHNTFIQPLAETGLLGVVPFLLLIGLAVYHARKLSLQNTDSQLRTLGAGLEASVWGFVICGLSGGYVLTWFPYFLLGMVSAARVMKRNQQ